MWEYTTRGLKGPPEALISWKARKLAKATRAYHWAPLERIATGALHFLRVMGAATSYLRLQQFQPCWNTEVRFLIFNSDYGERHKLKRHGTGR